MPHSLCLPLRLSAPQSPEASATLRTPVLFPGLGRYVVHAEGCGADVRNYSYQFNMSMNLEIGRQQLADGSRLVLMQWVAIFR